MNRPMKIIYIIGQLTIGGTETQLLELVRYLDRKQFSISVVSLSERAPLADAFRQLGCDVYLLERESGRFAVLRDLYRIFSDVQPDIIHAFAYASRAAIPVAKFFPGCKIIVSIRTQPEWQVALVDRVVNSFADYALTNSEKAWASLRSGFFRSVPGRVIYNGIDLVRFDASLQDELQGWNESGCQVICAVARLESVKGLDVLLRAFSLVVGFSANLRLWVVGEGPELARLQQLAVMLGIAEKVRFWGQQSNVPAFLRQAEIGALSSHVEGLPNAIIEYMAASLPAVSTDVGGIAELIRDGENGLLVPANQPQALADALMALLTNRELAYRLGQAGRAFVERNFAVQSMVAATQAVYDDLCLNR